MKTLGIIGGIGWESSAAYYQRLNRGVEARLGVPHSAHCLQHNLDYADTRLPLFESTEPHVHAALDFMLETHR
jgi:aspartate/glutamate racemase